ncbi:cell surface protein [Pseudoalteromonas luteoviolacea]|uniref:Cell surface protein n=1 Tax=Pseudoalteromonas luteoviolacea TaxID=43657 RepID=A0A1C0TPA8_9GAMM|nr:Hint domain-containing protein [Pseudoalteromonas luteoviolacea]OCQ20777.1 cell surface protein [Pseudoalteromonas luteoviolacea]
MKTQILVLSACATFFASMYAVAAVDPVIVKQRCENDSLAPAPARGRTDWALECRIITPRTHDFYVNDDYGNPKARPQYPSFTKTNDYTSFWIAPTSKTAGCSVRSGYSATITCTASCYTPDQKLLFAEGELTIYDAFTRKVSKIVTLDDDASLDNITYTVRNVHAYSESVVDVLHEILVIKTKNGGSLKVTPNHPLIISNGQMKNAEDIQIGESLIAENGDFDEITSIEEIEFYGKVYNVEPNSNGEHEVILNGQIVVAQGFLSGSMYYQNTGFGYVDKYVLRDNIPDDLI